MQITNKCPFCKVRFNEIKELSSKQITPVPDREQRVERDPLLEAAIDAAHDPYHDAVCEICKDGDPGYDHCALICDSCERVYHSFCLKLDTVPDDAEWFCDECRLRHSDGGALLFDGRSQSDVQRTESTHSLAANPFLSKSDLLNETESDSEEEWISEKDRREQQKRDRERNRQQIYAEYSNSNNFGVIAVDQGDGAKRKSKRRRSSRNRTQTKLNEKATAILVSILKDHEYLTIDEVSREFTIANQSMSWNVEFQSDLGDLQSFIRNHDTFTVVDDGLRRRKTFTVALAADSDDSDFNSAVNNGSKKRKRTRGERGGAGRLLRKLERKYTSPNAKRRQLNTNGGSAQSLESVDSGDTVVSPYDGTFCMESKQENNGRIAMKESLNLWNQSRMKECTNTNDALSKEREDDIVSKQEGFEIVRNRAGDEMIEFTFKRRKKRK